MTVSPGLLLTILRVGSDTYDFSIHSMNPPPFTSPQYDACLQREHKRNCVFSELFSSFPQDPQRLGWPLRAAVSSLACNSWSSEHGIILMLDASSTRIPTLMSRNPCCSPYSTATVWPFLTCGASPRQLSSVYSAITITRPSLSFTCSTTRPRLMKSTISPRKHQCWLG